MSVNQPPVHFRYWNYLTGSQTSPNYVFLLFDIFYQDQLLLARLRYDRTMGFINHSQQIPSFPIPAALSLSLCTLLSSVHWRSVSVPDTHKYDDTRPDITKERMIILQNWIWMLTWCFHLPWTRGQVTGDNPLLCHVTLIAFVHLLPLSRVRDENNWLYRILIGWEKYVHAPD